MVLRVLTFVMLFFCVGIAFLYLFPVQKVPFEKLYAKVDPETKESLQNFRLTHPAKKLAVEGATWEYVSCGSGTETILFIHGMTGSYDIWWNQITAFEHTHRVISVSHPAQNSLKALAHGILAILDAEGVDRFTVVGTSLGGYIAQYLVAQYPQRIVRAVFSNTFAPNDVLAELNGRTASLVPFLPEWLVFNILSQGFKTNIYATSENNELTSAFLLELASGRMKKSQIISRYKCIVEKFTTPKTTSLGVPILIVESDNDPLVPAVLREQLKTLYPDAAVRTFSAAGHFPYLCQSQAYTAILKDFIK